ncbi:hypothetical protein [Dyadobacter sp. CY312]|uniref:hypothetical protein n=1 Tax=Dyadobacter sp. CY312 TaxID=2907303 RepID=UPI001F1B3CE9|nr:hypothetical protein [Dyadobacter sp. CY312]MCE7040414.1 hypothetical protein [Dyadobacter sp. CY312]
MKNICAILILCTFCLSCKRKTKQDIEPIRPDIYLAGASRSANGIYTAQYWKNDKAVELVTSPYFPSAESIAVLGSDIHVLGQAHRDNTGAFGQYWKNGILTPLTKNMTPAWVGEIKIFGQDVYITGAGQMDNRPYSSPNYATYWKNGEAVVLADAVNGGAAGIFLSGNDVYLAGMASNDKSGVARYWKNGSRVTLGKDTDISAALAISVIGNDVHVVGWGGSYPNGHLYAKYWKNGVEVSLTDHSENLSMAEDIAIVGSDVFIVGYVERYLEKGGVASEAKIWKNGVPNTLPSGTRASDIFVFNNDIYVAGIGNGSPFERATYWKNGEPTFISDGTKNAWATSIFVKNP